MSRLTCVWLILLGTTSSLDGQTATVGHLYGIVTDSQGLPLPGVALSAIGKTTPTTRQASSDRDGQYRLSQLPPGQYELVAELTGFQRYSLEITVSVGNDLSANIRMTVGGIDETVVVSEAAPLLDTRSGGHAVNISGELLRSLPLSERREWFGALLLAPGVTSSEFANNAKMFYVHGADSTAQVIQIDGADMTPSGLSDVRFVGLSTDAIEDMQIKTAGVDASAPLGLGGIINIATASGTNTLKGLATLFAQPRAWNGSNTPGGTSSTVEQTQMDLSVGAPVAKDRLWVFAAYRYVNISTGISRTAAQLEALQALVPGFTPFDNHNRAHLWFAKGTAALSPSHQISGFYQRDVNPLSSGNTAAAQPQTRSTGGAGASLRLSSVWSDHLTTRIGASYNDKGASGRDAGGNEPVQAVYQGTRLSGGRLLGTSRLVSRGGVQTAWTEQTNTKVTLSFDSTFLVAGAAGSHEIQTGLYAQPRLALKAQDFYPNGGFIFEEAVLRQPNVFDLGVVPFHRLIYDSDTLTRLRRQGRDYAVYVQDVWRPRPRLTISTGVRVDWIAWTDRIFDVTSSNSSAVGPRFGLNYALTRDSRDVVKAHWVRVHDQPNTTGASVGSVTVGQRDLYDLDLDGTFETTFVAPATAAVTPGRTIDSDFHQPFIDEWGFGYAKQLPGAMTAALDLVRRSFRDRPTLLETNGRYDGNVFAGYVDEEFNEIYRATNNQWNWPIYTSLEMSVTKRTARLQGIASYVRQWRHLAGTWQPHDPASFIQPNAFPNNRAIGSTTGSTASPSEADSLNGYSMTQFETGSSQWQDHIVRLGATWTGPWRLLLASNYTFQSGSWSGPIVTLLPAPDPAFGPPTVALSNGRSVLNPLATTIRFAYPTRGEGQLTTPKLHVWNVRVGRRFSVRRIEFDASLDLFNLTNNDSDASFNLGANQTFGANFGTTTYRQLPRSGQFVLRASF